MKTNTHITLRVHLLAGGVALTLFATPAAAEQIFLLDVYAGAGASRNPFLQIGEGTSAASVFIGIVPQVRILDEVSEVTLDASLRYNRYARLYGDDASASANFQVDRRLSALTKLRAHASARVARTSVQDFIAGPGVGQPDQGAPVLLPDVTFAGSRSRTTTLDAGAGIEHQLSARDRLVAEIAVTSTSFSMAGQSDYRFLTGDLGFNRRLSDRMSAFAALRVGYSDFLAGKLDDGTVIAPTVGIKTQLNPRLSLEAGAGVSFSRINGLSGRADSRLVPSAQIVLCETNVDSKDCIRISRGSQPTAANGLTTVTTANFSRSQKISQWDQLAVGASYTRTDRSSTARTGQGYELLTASATYDHSFDRRVAGFVTPSYTRLFDSNVRRRGDISVLLGIRYRFGSQG